MGLNALASPFCVGIALRESVWTTHHFSAHLFQKLCQAPCMTNSGARNRPGWTQMVIDVLFIDDVHFHVRVGSFWPPGPFCVFIGHCSRKRKAFIVCRESFFSPAFWMLHYYFLKICSLFLKSGTVLLTSCASEETFPASSWSHLICLVI